MVKLIYLKKFFQLFKYESIFVHFTLYLIFIFMKKQTTSKPK